MDCLQLPRIRVKEAVSWTRRVLTRKFWLKNRSLFMTNKFKMKCLQKFYVSSKQEKEWYGKTTSYFEQQFKLLAVSFKPLRCCLRNDKLVNCHVWKFCKDLYLNLRVIWSVNQIVLFNGSSLILLRSLRVYILKQLFFLISVNSG